MSLLATKCQRDDCKFTHFYMLVAKEMIVNLHIFICCEILIFSIVGNLRNLQITLSKSFLCNNAFKNTQQNVIFTFCITYLPHVLLFLTLCHTLSCEKSFEKYTILHALKLSPNGLESKMSI